MKLKFVFIIFASALLFSSCLDVVQCVDFENGKYNFDFRISLSKSLLAIAREDLGDFDEIISAEDFPIESDFSCEIIDTEYEYGLAVKFSISPNTRDEAEKQFLPKQLKSGKILIPFFMNNEIAQTVDTPSDAEAQAIAEAILSFAKWRIFVSQKIAPSISRVSFAEKNSEDISFYKVGNFYCIEVPLSKILNGANLVVEK